MKDVYEQLSEEYSDGSFFDEGVDPDNVVKEQALRNVNNAMDKDPDRQAEVYNLAKERQLTPDIIDSELETVKRQEAIKKIDLSAHPKTASYLSDPRSADLSVDDIETLKNLETAMSKKDQANFFENTAKLTANQFVGLGSSLLVLADQVGAFESVKYQVEEMYGFEPKKITSESQKPFDAEQMHSTENVKREFSQGGLLSGIGEAGLFVAETGITSMADWVAQTINFPAYIAARAVQIGEENASNNNEDANISHTVLALPFAMASAYADRWGRNGIMKAGTDVKEELAKEIGKRMAMKVAKTTGKEVLKAAGKEAGTEFTQEIIEYVGERFGTEAEMDLMDAVERGAWGALAGGGTAAAISTPVSLYNQRAKYVGEMREKSVAQTFKSMDEQTRIDNIIRYSQESTTQKRSSEDFDKFLQKASDGREVRISNDAVLEAISQGHSFPEYITSKVDAFATGDIVIPMNYFARDIAPNAELVASIRDHIKMDGELLTPAEMDKGDTDLTIKELVRRAEKDKGLQSEIDGIYSQVAGELLATGRLGQSMARVSARIIPAYVNTYVTRARELGHEITPQEVFERMGLTVVGPSAVVREQATSKIASEDNRLGKLDFAGEHWAAIKENNPDVAEVKSGDDEVTIYRATKAGRISPDSIVYMDRADAEFDLAAGEEIIEKKVKVNDLLMGRNAKEIVYFPTQENVLSQDGQAMPDKITIDGVEKHTRNSNGDYIAADEQGIRNFYEWFGASKVVDADGRPLVVYHGSPDVRGILEEGFKPSPLRGSAFFFSDDFVVANTYADDRRAFDYQNAEPNVVPLYISIQNPMVIDAGGAKWRDTERHVQEAKDTGYDGVIIKNSRDEYNNTRDGGKVSTVFVTFEPSQAKSAMKRNLLSRIDRIDIGGGPNVGSFSRETGNIYYQEDRIAESSVRGWIPKVRGGWTKSKILKTLKGPKPRHSGVGVQKYVAEFNSPEELADNIFYHGTPGVISGGLRPSITMSDKEMESAGGGYGEKYWAASVSKSKERSSWFTGQSRSGRIYPVILRKGAKIIDMPEIQDTADIEGVIENLWNDGIDAVRIGDWSKEGSEKELAIINPAAAFLYDKPKSFQVFGKEKFPDLTKEEIESIYKDSVEYREKVRRMDYEDRKKAVSPDVLFQKSESGFYSQLQKAAEELKQEKGTPDQMLAMLKKAGAKDAEIEATGLKDFLELAGKSITKAQIVEFVSNNGVQVETTILSYSDVEHAVFDGDETQYFPTREDAISYANEQGINVTEDTVYPARNRVGGISVARNTNYTLPGGENHVELVLSIPNIEGWNQGDTTHYGDIADGKAVAWVRANDRTDADGKKVLFIEEIQSKRAQEGRSKGFVEKYTREGIEPIREGIEVTDPERFWYFRVPGNVLQILKSRHQTEEDAINYIIKEKTIRGYAPPAPFVEKTDAWVSLAMKRMITYAVENGYDRVAWTTGEQQSIRYKLSTKVNEIVYRDNGILIGIAKNKKVFEEQVSEDKLPSFIGKKASEKLLKAKTNLFYRNLPELGMSRTIKGRDLYVGGEGMKSFYDKIIPSVAKEVTKKMDGKVVELSIDGVGKQPGFDITDKMREQVQGPGLPLFQSNEKARGLIYLKDNGERIIKLAEASDPSTFLHESAHLFLDMEKDFVRRYGITKDQQTILDWLGVESFDDIGVEQHEKFAETFEVYLREGKAPSLALRDVFARFKSWLEQIYETLNKLRRQDINPEIREVFDRLLATRAEIDAATANPAYDQYFRTKDQAGMSDAEWEEYKSKQQAKKDRVKESIDKKLLDEYTRQKKAEWNEERKEIYEKEVEALKETPLYRLIAKLKDVKLDRDQARELFGLPKRLTAHEIAQKRKVVELDDSLLVMAAKRGGLDRDAWEAEGVDPEVFKDRKIQNRVFGYPLFVKGGMTPDQLAELASDFGYGGAYSSGQMDEGSIRLTANEALDLVMQELAGNPVLTYEGMMIKADAEADEGISKPKAPLTRNQEMERKIARVTSSEGGADIELIAEELGYDAGIDMMMEVIDAKPLATQARENAQQAMLKKYGDILNDGTLEQEVREAAANEEQAETLLMEIRALKRKTGDKKKINVEYLRNKAQDMIDSMKFSEIRPNDYYLATIKAAKQTISADTDEKRLEAKTRQLANHYLYKAALETKEKMEKERKYIRKAGTMDWKAGEVHPDYKAHIHLLVKMYDMRMSPLKTPSLEKLIIWYDTQVKAAQMLDDADHGNRKPLTWMSEELVLALNAHQKGRLEEFSLTHFDDMTQSQLRGLYETVKHLRYIGGQMSDTEKNKFKAEQELKAATVRKNAGAAIPPKHESTRLDDVFQATEGFIYSHRDLGGIIDTLNGFEDGAFTPEYQMVVDSANKELSLQLQFNDAMSKALKGITGILSVRKKNKIIKQDGKPFILSNHARFVLGLNMGNQSNIDAVLEGLNAVHGKTSGEFVYQDLVAMISGMSKAELDALNKTWAAKEALWPEASAVQRAMGGVSATKIEATPLVINGVILTGGHYRLHYKSSSKDSGRSEIEVKKINEQSIQLSKVASQIERVGSGGREVNLEDLGLLFSDVAEDIHFIAWAETAARLNKTFKGARNPVPEAIISRYGNDYYRNLIDTIDVIINPPTSNGFISKFGRYIRSNMTYSLLAFSYRNIIQQPTAVTNVFSQLGEKHTLAGIYEFYSHPMDNFKKVDAMSVFMRKRTALVNRESRDAMEKINALHPVLGKIKTLAFTPQSFMDALVAYPAWMGAYKKYMRENPLVGTDVNARQKSAVDFADRMVQKTVGSGLSKDVGAILNKDEMTKQITFMGTFFNVTYNMHVENAQLFKRGKITWYEYARRLGWMAVAPAVIGAFLLDDIPEDDEEIPKHLALKVLSYNLGSVFLLREATNFMISGFEPNIPMYEFVGGLDAIKRAVKIVNDDDEELDADNVARLIRGASTVIPLLGAGQVARTIQGADDEEQGVWGALVEGKERNK